MADPAPVADIYDYALELVDSHQYATTVAIAWTSLDEEGHATRIGAAVICVRDRHGDPVSGRRIEEADAEESVVETLIATAGIRGVAQVRRAMERAVTDA